MPTLFFAFLALAMLANVAAAFALFRDQAREVALLRARHPAEWERLGRPRMMMRGFRMPTNYEWTGYRALNDPALEAVCADFRRSAYRVVGMALGTSLIMAAWSLTI
jgi:hypothetical protein